MKMDKNEIKYKDAKAIIWELEQVVNRHFNSEFEAGKIIVTERFEHTGKGLELVILDETDESIWHGDFLDGVYCVLKGTGMKYTINDDVMTVFEA